MDVTDTKENHIDIKINEGHYAFQEIYQASVNEYITRTM